MDSHQLDIVRLAWCRHLGLDDKALDDTALDTAAHRVEHVVDDDARSVTVLQLAGTVVVSGPRWALELTRGVGTDELFGRPGLAALLDGTAPGRTHSDGPLVLAYGGEIGHSIDVHDPLVSHRRAHLLAVEAHCSAGDTVEAHLGRTDELARSFTILGDDRPADSADSLATAGYAEWQSILADVSVLTAPAHRRRGYAHAVAQLATNDAIDEGLIPQWRARTENSIARRLAARLGYTEAGMYVSVTWTSPD